MSKGEDLNWTREEALSKTIDLFTHTNFREMIKIGKDGTVSDVPFYSTVYQIYEFLQTGKFPAYEVYVKSLTELPKVQAPKSAKIATKIKKKVA